MGKVFPLLTTRQITLLLARWFGAPVQTLPSRNERLDGTGRKALTYCIRMKLDALRLYAESRVVVGQPSQSIRNTDGG